MPHAVWKRATVKTRNRKTTPRACARSSFTRFHHVKDPKFAARGKVRRGRDASGPACRLVLTSAFEIGVEHFLGSANHDRRAFAKARFERLSFWDLVGDFIIRTPGLCQRFDESPPISAVAVGMVS